MTKPRRFAALDTSVLFSLAAGDDEAAGAIDELNDAEFFFLIPATVLQELAEAEIRGTPELKTAAAKTIECMRVWGFLAPPLDPAMNGVADVVADALLERGIISPPSKNDALIISEAACHDCLALVTKRKSLLDADSDALRLTLIRRHVKDTFVLSPGYIMYYFQNGGTKQVPFQGRQNPLSESPQT